MNAKEARELSIKYEINQLNEILAQVKYQAEHGESVLMLDSSCELTEYMRQELEDLGYSIGYMRDDDGSVLAINW